MSGAKAKAQGSKPEDRVAHVLDNNTNDSGDIERGDPGGACIEAAGQKESVMQRPSAEFPAQAEIQSFGWAESKFAAEHDFGPGTHEKAGPLEALEKALTGRRTNLQRYRYLLLFRFIVVNMAGFALLGAAHFQGWVTIAAKADSTGIVFLIFGLFLVGLVICGMRIWRTSAELNLIKTYDPLEPSRVTGYLQAVKLRSGGSRSLTANSFRIKMGSRIGIVRHIANTLVFLGLIGTVLGFIIALSGVDPDLASDVKSVGPMVSTLINGMSVALYTTLVGAVFNIWLMINYRLLASGTINLITAVVELGETYARRD